MMIFNRPTPSFVFVFFACACRGEPGNEANKSKYRNNLNLFFFPSSHTLSLLAMMCCMAMMMCCVSMIGASQSTEEERRYIQCEECSNRNTCSVH